MQILQPETQKHKYNFFSSRYLVLSFKQKFVGFQNRTVNMVI